MTSRSELDRKEIRDSGSPLSGHSLNQKNMRDQRAGEIKFLGQTKAKVQGLDRRVDSKRQREQVLFESIGNIFQGTPSEEDILNIFMFADEFEKVNPEAPNAAVIVFQGMQSSDESYGEPGFFRLDKK
jgi:hypothetical protein